ncbi:hypothetical protein SAMN05518849_11447 [Sphingobium sp. AP50]|nr:hypothetical protein SAMN05518849_11447 [Sphingobium sp. AP50]
MALSALAARARRILKSDEAAAAIWKGIVRAARDCERWGGDWPTDRGCENLLQVRAAEELHEVLAGHKLGWLTLEQPLADIIWEGTSQRGRPQTGLSEQKRADIAIWSKSERIYAVAEIKRAEADRDWQLDLEKIARILSRYGRRQGNHMRYGILGVFISRRRGSLLAERGVALKKLAATVAANFGLKQRTVFDHGNLHHYRGGDNTGWTCGAASVVLSL